MVKVRIQYCGGWGYGRHFRSAGQLINEKFPGIEIEEVKDPGKTGNFEIEVDGKLVHSKKTQDHGFLHTNESQKKVVFDAIETATKC